MAVVGCLLLVILPLLGLVVGGFFGGLEAGLWAAAGGFGVALLICAISVLALVRARDR